MKIKHLLLIILIVFLIYLDILWFNSFNYDELKSTDVFNVLNTIFYTIINIFGFIYIIFQTINYLWSETTFFETINKYLNQKIL